MAELRQKMNISNETISAIFIVAFISLFILSNFIIGFSLSFYALTMLFGGIIAFLYPRSGLYAIIFLTFIFERFFTLQPVILGRAEYKLYPLDIIFLAIILGILFQVIFEKIKITFKKIDYCLWGFIFLAVIYFLAGIFVSENDFDLSFSGLKNYAFYPLFYFAVLFLLQKKEHIMRLLKFALAGAIVIAFFIFYGIINGSGLWSEFTPLSTEGVRLLAFTHGFYLSMAFLGLLTYVLYEKIRHIKLYYALMAIWIVGILGSMMRHLWLGLIISLAVLYFLIPKLQKNKLKIILIASAAILIFIIIFSTYFSLLFPRLSSSQTLAYVGSVISQRINSFFDISNEESFSWRSAVWREGLKEYSKNPALGTGLGKKIYIEMDNYRDFIAVREIHNSPLSMFIQMGIIPFALFIILIYKNAGKLLNKAIRGDWLNMLLLIVMVNYLIVFLFQPYLETNLLGIFFWMILGIVRVKNYEPR